MVIRNPFSNPHYLAGSVLARLAVNFATLIWSIVVLSTRDVLISAPTAYAWVTGYVHEDLLASALGALALTQLIWLAAHWPPIRWHGAPVCSLGYGTMAAAWAFALGTIIFGSRPIQPTSTACVSVVVMLALFAFVSNARGPGDDPGA